MGQKLDRISIRGYRSIRELNGLSLGELNVLVGANGAGKSNFVDFFRLLRAMREEGLQTFVRDSGGADGFCFGGVKETPQIAAHLVFGDNEYQFTLKPEVSGEMTVEAEATYWDGGGGWDNIYIPKSESRLKQWKGKGSKWGPYPGKEHYVSEAVAGWVVYHVHDTSRTAPMRRRQPAANSRELLPDAGNIAAFLRRVRQEHELYYRRIRDTVQLVAPFFDDFILDVEKEGENELTRLEWQQRGSSFPYQPWQLSDGTIRFICLCTALLQPSPPSTIVIDEPELGLHPFALKTLAGLVHESSVRMQVILSTQSPVLLNEFEPEHVIVVDRENGASRFQRLDAAALAGWLEDYALGELLQKNVIEASPRYES